MPLYEYRCHECGSTRELLRPSADADAAVACVCGAADVVRLPSLIARAATGSPSGDLPLLGASSGASPRGGSGGCCGGGCCGWRPA